MRIETLLREAMTEWSEQATPAPDAGDLARRSLRHRTRQRAVRATLATAVAGALIATGATFALREPGGSVDRGTLVPGRGGDPLAGGRLSVGEGLYTDPDSAPPKSIVAAGDLVLSAYYTTGVQRYSKQRSALRRTWYLLDPSKRTYQKTPWAYVRVAPGLARAAVLAGPLPTRRVGILDMTSGAVIRWITLQQNAGGVEWSPDGRRLLATAYRQDPDLQDDGLAPTSTRTGFELIDLTTMKGRFVSLPADQETFGTRQDIGWSRDGKLIFAPTDTVPTKVFYDLNGEPQAAPAHEADASQEAGLSPDGEYLANDAPNQGPGPATAVYSAATGAQVGVQKVEQLVAWADDRNLIAIACDVRRCTGKGEFRNRYVLVGIDGTKVVPLTGYQKDSQAEGAWHAEFTRR